jgi:hypothetical protein
MSEPEFTEGDLSRWRDVLDAAKSADETVGLVPAEYAFRVLPVEASNPKEWTFQVLHRAHGLVLDITLRIDDLVRLRASSGVAVTDFDYELSRRERKLDQAGG